MLWEEKGRGRSQLHIKQLSCDTTCGDNIPPCPREAPGSTCMATAKSPPAAELWHPVPHQYPPLSTGNGHWQGWEGSGTKLEPVAQHQHSGQPLHRHICKVSSDLHRGEPQGAPLPNLHHTLKTRQGSTSTSSAILSTSALLLKGSLRGMGKGPEPPQPSSPFSCIHEAKTTAAQHSTAHCTGSGVGWCLQPCPALSSLWKALHPMEQLSGMHPFTLIC